MTDNKDGAEKATIKILNGYTKNTKFSYGYEFPIGLIGDIEKALNEFYDAGVKDGAKAERERAAKVLENHNCAGHRCAIPEFAKAIRRGQDPGNER